MGQMISILLEQIPSKIGQMERKCVEDSLDKCLHIIYRELISRVGPRADEDIVVLDVLANMFNRKQIYYKGQKSNWNNTSSGLPEARIHLIDKFTNAHGFAHLGAYLEARVGIPDRFPSFRIIRDFLIAAKDILQYSNAEMDKQRDMEDDIIRTATAVMDFLMNLSEDALKKISPDDLNSLLRYDLQPVFEYLLASRREETYKFFDFYRAFTLRLISSQSLPLKLFGWDCVTQLVDYSESMAPPPRSYIVEGAGVDFVNGMYEFAAKVGSDGFFLPNTDLKYVKTIPERPDDPNSGKKLTLFRCTMRSQQKWWFISEADEQQPGTDKDIDYYQRKSSKGEETLPPQTKWTTCRHAGVDPPPMLYPQGVMVPTGEEFNTMEHQLAEWAIENKVMEHVLGASIHRETVSRSTRLFTFLAQMCTKDSSDDASKTPMRNVYCLNSSHLSLAWKTCVSKLDSAISAEVYNLLVSIMSVLPSDLAINLLGIIGDSTGDSLYEVAEFCSALAKACESANTLPLADETRRVLLQLLWKVLTHPDASSLKCYDDIKAFMTNELRVEPLGSKERQDFIQMCKDALKSSITAKTCDENSALRMVRVTRFVLESCPREQAANVIYANNGELANLLFDEVMAFMSRALSHDHSSHGIKKSLSNSKSIDDFDHTFALNKRLGILRYVYGISGTIEMSIKQLDAMWNICSAPCDKEAIMTFLARSSQDDQHTSMNIGPAPPHDANVFDSSHHALSAAFSEDVKVHAFTRLFCSANMHWEHLGKEAYYSFQTLFKSLGDETKRALTSHGPALDALWRICLIAGDDEVATSAMKDLLLIYTNISEAKRKYEDLSNNVWTKDRTTEEAAKVQKIDPNEKFSSKIYSCLLEVKSGLKRCDPLAGRSAERCVRILNSAVGNEKSGHGSFSLPFEKLSSINSLQSIVDDVPHGYRSQLCYTYINITAKRAQANAQRHRFERFMVQVHPFDTLQTLKEKVANFCSYPVENIKPISLESASKRNLNIEPENTLISDLGVSEGAEIIFLLCPKPLEESSQSHSVRATNRSQGLSSSEIFGGNGIGPTDEFFDALLDVLESLSQTAHGQASSVQTLVWNLLQSVPSNKGIVHRVRTLCQSSLQAADESLGKEIMLVDISRYDSEWKKILDPKLFQRSIYILQVIDSFLQPTLEIVYHAENRKRLESCLVQDAHTFRTGFIESGGFDAVLSFFTMTRDHESTNSSNLRVENACVLRIFKACFCGRSNVQGYLSNESATALVLDETGANLLKSIASIENLLLSLTSIAVLDSGTSSVAIIDSILLIHSILTANPSNTLLFAKMPNGLAEKLVVNLLLWEEKECSSVSSIENSSRIRKTTKDFILQTTGLALHVYPWLIRALETLSISLYSTNEFFSVLINLVDVLNRDERVKDLESMSYSVCMKLVSHKDRMSHPAIETLPTTVLSGCLNMLQAIVLKCEPKVLSKATSYLLQNFQTQAWPQTGAETVDNKILMPLISIIFDCFLFDGNSSQSSALCSDRNSCIAGFEVLEAIMQSCDSGSGFIYLTSRLNNIVATTSLSIRHKWDGYHEEHAHSGIASSKTKFSGLKNQGCTCYMNSVLQQLFMMPELRQSISSATLPISLRSLGGKTKYSGQDLIGKCISLQWDSGTYYQADVLSYSSVKDTHIIRYRTLTPSSNRNRRHNYNGLDQQLQNVDTGSLPLEPLEEFVLTQGRPGKETGHFVIVASDEIGVTNGDTDGSSTEVEESEDETAYRRLLEEVQRVFVHLEGGSRGRVFDPRSLVESSACLKLEFDIWQQNDASEFAMKLLDKLEVPLKRWCPREFRFLENTFRLKQTKQKICKECGLKTNREENLMNIDCQIRGITDIHEALSTFCEVEYMEGDNKVFCETCKKKCDTILRTAISSLPDMLVLSLKRFDLDYNTFETVKLNSRCEFGQTLNMKRYTLEGVEAMEKASEDLDTSGDIQIDPLDDFPDENYEYKLAGVLVHAGVAQGGHYYSFIRDRSDNEWYRFDDEDVTQFDPTNIETECFGGKVKKETKWPNGQVNTVETEQLANALMLFYEKVKPTHKHKNDDAQMDDTEEKKLSKVAMTTGSEEFKADVKKSNSLHRSHTFLFGNELRTFIKRMLDLISQNQHKSETYGSPMAVDRRLGDEALDWKLSILDLSLKYFFDILLHSNEKHDLEHWAYGLVRALKNSPIAALSFVKEVARRSKLVAENWLYTYVADCPEYSSRAAAIEVFSAAFIVSVSNDRVKENLVEWSRAWIEQVNSWNTDDENSILEPMACKLIEKWSHFEDVDSESPHVSEIGAIISYISYLIDIAPRTWRYNTNLMYLIKRVASADDVMRNALIATQFPARLICLILRGNSRSELRKLFPGPSTAPEIIEAISKIETSSANLLHLSGSVPHVAPSVGAPSPIDHLHTYEALAILMGVEGGERMPLYREAGTSNKGRTLVELTVPAQNVFTLIFNEFSSQPGALDQRDVFRLLQRCGVAANNIHNRATKMLNSYGDDSSTMSLNGFLAYFRDNCTTNEAQILSELHSLGFRPDLTRRSQVSFDTESKNATENLVRDVSKMVEANKCYKLRYLAGLGLTQLDLYSIANYSNCHLAEYIITMSILGHSIDPTVILVDSLKALFHSQSGWGGNESASVVLMVLKVIACIPDDRQIDRISMIMMCDEAVGTSNSVQCGLIHASRHYALLARNNNSIRYTNEEYNNDSLMIDRYTEIIQELKKVPAVSEWFSAHKDSVGWLEQWLKPSVTQDRGDSQVRRDGTQSNYYHNQAPFDHQTQSDSGSSIQDSEEDDFDNVSYTGINTGVLVVSGAGVAEVNGTYSYKTENDGVSMYKKDGIWEGDQVDFALFRCRLSDNSQRWFISIVPNGKCPGTNKDIDFYKADADGRIGENPHGYQWTSDNCIGQDPPPIVQWKPNPETSEQEGDEELVFDEEYG
jgi:ubiquitin carboxyl-terminal hydrolase 9/24